MTLEEINKICGTAKNHKLKKYVLTRGGLVIESRLLHYDDFINQFCTNKNEVVIIEKEFE